MILHIYHLANRNTNTSLIIEFKFVDSSNENLLCYTNENISGSGKIKIIFVYIVVSFNEFRVCHYIQRNYNILNAQYGIIHFKLLTGNNVQVLCVI